jgi:hypothetical protein
MFAIRVKQRWAGHDAYIRKTRNLLKVGFKHLYRRDSAREVGTHGKIITKLSLQA